MTYNLDDIWESFLTKVQSPILSINDNELRKAYRKLFPNSPLMPEGHAKVCPTPSCHIEYYPEVYWNEETKSLSLEEKMGFQTIGPIHVCKHTGYVHSCNDRCEAPKYLNQGDEGYVCRMSGRCFGPHLCADWWSEWSQQVERRYKPATRDVYASYQASETLAKSRLKPYDSKRKKETIKFIAHWTGITSPLERPLDIYIGRAHAIIQEVLFSTTREKAEEQRWDRTQKTLQKDIQNYVRQCQTDGSSIYMDRITAITFKTLQHVAWGTPTLMLEDHTQQKLVAVYAKFLSLFFRVLLEQISQRFRHHSFPSSFPFDYVVISCLSLMHGFGLECQGQALLPKDSLLKVIFPDWPILQKLGIQPSTVTTTKNAIRTATTLAGPDPFMTLWKKEGLLS